MIDGQAADSVQVRTIVSEDAGFVAELCRQLGYEVTVPEVVERIGLLLGSTMQTGLVACIGTEVVGWIEAMIVHLLQYPAHTVIGGLVVKDGLRGQGVGKHLCAAVERWSRARDIHVIRVTSRSTRQAAHRFYLREGYLQTKTSAVFEKILF